MNNCAAPRPAAVNDEIKKSVVTREQGRVTRLIRVQRRPDEPTNHLDMSPSRRRNRRWTIRAR